MKWSHFRRPTQQPNTVQLQRNQVKFDPPQWNDVRLNHPHKCESICVLTLKTSDFRPAFKNQVNFELPHNNQINFIPTLISNHTRSPALKSSQFRPPTQKRSQLSCLSWKRVIFGEHTNNKSTSTTHTKLIFMLLLKQVVLGQHTINTSISTTHTTTKPISSYLHWNQFEFDPPHWVRSSQFRPSQNPGQSPCPP